MNFTRQQHIAVLKILRVTMSMVEPQDYMFTGDETKEQ